MPQINRKLLTENEQAFVDELMTLHAEIRAETSAEVVRDAAVHAAIEFVKRLASKHNIELREPDEQPKEWDIASSEITEWKELDYPLIKVGPYNFVAEIDYANYVREDGKRESTAEIRRILVHAG
jgi:hypothetical protein